MANETTLIASEIVAKLALRCQDGTVFGAHRRVEMVHNGDVPNSGALDLTLVIEALANNTFWALDFTYSIGIVPIWEMRSTIQMYRVWPVPVTVTTWVTKEPT